MILEWLFTHDKLSVEQPIGEEYRTQYNYDDQLQSSIRNNVRTTNESSRTQNHYNSQ